MTNEKQNTQKDKNREIIERKRTTEEGECTDNGRAPHGETRFRKKIKREREREIILRNSEREILNVKKHQSNRYIKY